MTLSFDAALRLQAASPAAYAIFSIVESDVGRPLRDLNLRQEDPGLLDSAEAAIASLKPGAAATVERFGRRYLRSVQLEGAAERDPPGLVVSYAPHAPSLPAIGNPERDMQQALAESIAQYQTIGESIPFGVWISDPEGKLVYASTSFLEMTGLTLEEARDFGWSAGLEPGTSEKTLAAWRDCVEKGLNWEWEHRFAGADGEAYAVLSLGRPVRAEDGRITSWVGLNIDITERKREEERLQILSAELDHRVKNMLTVVNSMVRLTGRRAQSLKDYQRSLEARIQAMARAHLTVTEEQAGGMSLARLVEDELGPYRLEGGDRILIDGPEAYLAPRAAQSLALALHELATNAAKYGALKIEGGSLAVTWTIETTPKTCLVLVWKETGHKSLRAPRREGFGTTVVTQVLEAQLNADVELGFEVSGVRCVVRLSDDWFAGTRARLAR